MKKNRRTISFIIILLVFFLNVTNIYAADHRLEEQEIEVYINPDGSGRVKERRLGNFIEGTENFIEAINLGESEIIDFVVYENEEQFDYVEDWNINAPREEKIRKNSIIKTSNGYELSWGIGDYGRHEYNLEYTITNLVKGLEDSQMIYYKFVNDGTNIPPENVRVTISSGEEFSQDNERIWGFGFDGDIQFENGNIVAVANGPLDSRHHVTILVKLPQGMFLTNDILNQSFEDIQEQAFVGSSYEEGVSEEGGMGENLETKRNPLSTIMRVFSRVFSLGIFAIFAMFLGRGFKGPNKSPVKFKRKYKEEYFRDYPYEGHFLDIYYIPYMIGATDFEKLLTGFILKWIRENRIRTVVEEVGWVFKKDTTNLKFLNTEALEHPLEDELFQMMLEAAGANEILEEKEFTSWAKKNTSSIDSWEKKIREYSMERLQELGYLNKTIKKFLFIKTPEYELTESGKEMEINIYKYINYLYDFSLLNEHEAINVTIWDNIMIWAGFLGLTEVVTKQFEKLYPQYMQETVYTGNTIFLTSHLARNISQTRASASTSASSGFGGGTSIGGGGGSFGGGGGGTR